MPQTEDQGNRQMVRPYIPLAAGLIIFWGCFFYVRSKRPPRGKPFPGRGLVLALLMVAIGLMLYALTGFLTESTG
jgi:hypothetical protein